MTKLGRMLRAWLARRRIRRLPAIAVVATADFYKPFTAPNPDLTAVIRSAAGEQVATAAYAVSPLSDRLYIFEVEVAAKHRRRGYATSLLWHLAQTYGLPITPVQERSDASAFWSAARRLHGAGIHLTEPLSAGELDAERVRWRHLQPQIERLERCIRERLTVRREPWHVAVGRGLED